MKHKKKTDATAILLQNNAYTYLNIGEFLESLGATDRAISQYRAANAQLVELARAYPDYKVDRRRWRIVSDRLVTLLATSKLAASASSGEASPCALAPKPRRVPHPRPHYADDALRARLKRELGLFEYSSTHFKCKHCGKRPVGPHADGGLMRCSKCLWVWYCGPDCQRAHWPRHKLKNCKPVSTYRLVEKDKARFERMLREDGHLVTSQDDWGMALFVDPDTGGFFDSITNYNVEFVLPKSAAPKPAASEKHLASSRPGAQDDRPQHGGAAGGEHAALPAATTA